MPDDDNVIRPAFGAPRRPAPAGPEAAGQPVLRILGTGAGHRVGLIRDPAAQEGAVFRVVVGPEDEPEVETVALLPATADAEAEAERIGFAVLRALEVIEGAL
ncbi:hypothetical protein MKK75_10065 [Methylobacterium sp. J-030]|uniref:hypothetical protein n=1 Tax=Methylobacterium sp. J-030 TaxID=2836627 RepID=UPI001FBA5180|nr:hypothetical protein [Methylobacterium sp. J-030]MCJ2069143.1 hypothetical protein [Methylobacterium sp. J-030]